MDGHGGRVGPGAQILIEYVKIDKIDKIRKIEYVKFVGKRDKKITSNL